MEARQNRNRGYQQLKVWKDAIEFYKVVSRVYHGFPYFLGRVASQNVSAADSVHRNIAEGYARRSINEYLQFLYIALGSLAETTSGAVACRAADQISAEDFESIDSAAYKLEYGLLRLVESLERKRASGGWTDNLVVPESLSVYEARSKEEDAAAE